MISAALAAPARGGRVVFSLGRDGHLALCANAQTITVYVARLDVEASAAPHTLRQRQQHLINSLLREHEALDGATTALALATTERGKPYWRNSRWQLNWSHSQDCVALSIAPRHDGSQRCAMPAVASCAGELGIDIERLGRSRARAALVARYFHPDERAIADDERGFLSIWTRKEAVLKAHGLGLRIDLKSLNTTTDPIVLTAPMPGSHAPNTTQWQCLSLALTEAQQAIAVLSLSWPQRH